MNGTWSHATVDGAALTLLSHGVGHAHGRICRRCGRAHGSEHSALPSGRELAHLGHVSFGSFGVVVVPMGILGISEAGVIDVAGRRPVRAISATLAVTLVVVTLLAVRGLRVGPWRKGLALAITAALGLAALCVELAVH